MKIQLVRFMSDFELQLYLSGEEMENNTIWGEKRGHQASGSEGFCFFPLEGNDPMELVHILSGIATMEKVVILETEYENVRKSVGRYRDPEKDKVSLETLFRSLFSPPEAQMKEEYCTKAYNIETFKPLRIGSVLYPYYEPPIVWEWWAGLPASPKGAAR